MPSYGGPGATITIGTFNGSINSISCDGASIDQIDTSHMASPNDWRTFISGLRDGGTITVVSHYDPEATDPPIPGDEGVAVKIDAGGTLGITASCNVSGMSVSIDKDGLYTVTHTLKVTGALDLYASLA